MVLPFYSRLRSPHARLDELFDPDRPDESPMIAPASTTRWAPLAVHRLHARRGQNHQSRLAVFQPGHTDTPESRLDSNFYLWPLYKFNGIHAPPLDRDRTRILFFLYSHTMMQEHGDGQFPNPHRFLAVLYPPARLQRQHPPANLRSPRALAARQQEHRAQLVAALVRLACGEQSRRPAPPASRCFGIFTGAKPRPRPKKARSCSGFSSMNPTRKPNAGGYFTSRRRNPRVLPIMFQNIGEMVLLFWRTLAARCRSPGGSAHKVFDQFFEIGNASLLMVCVLSFFIGGVIALQTGPVLVERGLANAVGGLVGISIAKELAPDHDGDPHRRAASARPWRRKSAPCASIRKSTRCAR